MTGNKSFLTDYQETDSGFFAFGGSPKGGKVNGKGKIRTGKLNFEDVYFVKELKFNLFSVSQMCYMKNNILFTETECVVLSPDFKLLDERGLTCLFAKATIDESNLWHRRLGHINFKTMNKLVWGNLVRVLASKLFENDHTCVACQKGKQHKASSTRDETSGILKTFITGIENQINHKVKIIRCDNGTEFKNNDMNQFCGMKGIKREFSVARTPQQNRVSKRKNRTLIEAAKTMLSTDNKDADEVPGKGDDDLSERNSQEKEKGATNKEDDQHMQDFRAEWDNLLVQQKEGFANNTNRFFTVNPSVSAVGQGFDNADDQERIDSSTQDINTTGPSINTTSENINTSNSNINTAKPIPNDPNMQSLEATGIFSGAYDDDDVGAEADLNNMEITMNVSTIPTTRIYKDHPKDQIIGDINSATQTRRMTKITKEHDMVSYIKRQRRTNHKDYQNYLFACFLSQIEPKKVIQALTDPSWIEAMQEELLQFKLQKKDKRGIVVKNKATLVAQGYTQEEGIDYDEVFAPVARIEAIRLFLAYASFMRLVVYQMDVNSAFLYGTIEEEVAWYETLSTYLLENGYRRGTIDKTLFIKKDRGDILLVQAYVDDIIFRSTKKSLYVEFKQMMYKKFHMSSIGELTFFLGLQVMQKDDGIFISQDKYVADILKKFDFVSIETASTLIETNKALLTDEEAEDVDVHLYRLMIRSLMYLTASRPDIMFDVCACASDYAGASLDRKSTTGGCQFLGKRLISWQCKKQTIVANSTTEAEYVAAANCYGQVLWIQNQMLDYGFNFMNTNIHIDNESTIYIVKNPMFHSKTKHIEIRHHFIRDSYEKKLIQVIKIHTDHNVADLLTKAFDVSRKAKRTTKISQSSRPIHLVVDETVYKEWEYKMERAATTSSSLEAEQDSGNINKTQSMATLNESFPRGTGSGSGTRCQDTILGGAKA
ncbi:retrovirus-related pol polyprotein from transposon TNT 1-94 [Tanacetum coccineum]